MTNKKTNQRNRKKTQQTDSSSSPTKSPTSAVSHGSSHDDSNLQLSNQSADNISNFSATEDVNPDEPVADSRDAQIAQIELLKKRVRDQKGEHDIAKQQTSQAVASLNQTHSTLKRLKWMCFSLFILLIIQQVVMMLKVEPSTKNVKNFSPEYNAQIANLSAKIESNTKLAEQNKQIETQNTQSEKDINQITIQLEKLNKEITKQEEQLKVSKSSESDEVKKVQKQLDESEKKIADEVSKVTKNYEGNITNLQLEKEQLDQALQTKQSELNQTQMTLEQKQKQIKITQAEIAEIEKKQNEAKRQIEIEKETNKEIKKKVKDKKIMVQFNDATVPPLKLQQIVQLMRVHYLDPETLRQTEINPQVSYESKIEEEVAMMVWLDAYSQNDPKKISGPCAPQANWQSRFGRDCLMQSSSKALDENQIKKVKMLTQVFQHKEGIQVHAMCNFKIYFENLMSKCRVPHVSELSKGILDQIKDNELVQQNCK